MTRRSLFRWLLGALGILAVPATTGARERPAEIPAGEVRPGDIIRRPFGDLVLRGQPGRVVRIVHSRFAVEVMVRHQGRERSLFYHPEMLVPVERG